MAGFPKGAKRLGSKAKEPKQNGIPIDDSTIMTLIKQYRGNISRIADALGTTRSCIYGHCERNPDLKSAINDARERYIDQLEDSVWERALDSNDSTIQIFLLKTAGRKRGYDQDMQNGSVDIAKAAFDYVLNKSKNPAE